MIPIHPITAAPAKRRAGPRRHRWIFLRTHVPTVDSEAFGTIETCPACELQRLRLYRSGVQIAVSYRVPGRTGWAPLDFARPACPPSGQDLLNLERIGHAA